MHAPDLFGGTILARGRHFKSGDEWLAVRKGRRSGPARRLEHRAEKWTPVLVKAMRKQKAMANEPIHKIGSLL
jgi:hypothetical protein